MTTSASIGIVGGGQLAWLLAREAHKLDVDLHVQTPDPNDPAARDAASVVLAPLDDLQATRVLAGRAERISFENEWLALSDLEQLERDGIPFLPPLSALAPLLDKRSQRQLLGQLNLPTPHWIPLEDVYPPAPPLIGDAAEEAFRVGWLQEEPLHGAGTAASSPAPPPGPRLPEGFTFPVIVKASRGGYDGKGTHTLTNLTELEHHLAAVNPQEWILEEKVAFSMELAQVVCRDLQGVVKCFPLVQTHQRDQVCDWVVSPAPVCHRVEAYARNVAMSLVTSLNYVGVMGIEFFYGPRGLQVNEVAPRVHNSGHLTLEACSTNQFAQHVRIVAGLPMGPMEPKVKGALMVNLLGHGPATGEEASNDYKAQREALEALTGAHLYWYGKQPRLGRKLGHITFVLEAEDAAEREAECARRLQEVRALWPWPELAPLASRLEEIYPLKSP